MYGTVRKSSQPIINPTKEGDRGINEVKDSDH